MIPRSAERALKALAGQFPAVILLGPRQCGKTTLMRHFVDARYFDLERPSDLQVFSGDIEYALQNLREPLILDEAQTLPALFPVIRAVIDATRRKNGRFFLLGSVSPELLTSISESLAGRVGILELTPFIYSEVAGRRGMKLEYLWLRGGYPDALLARDAAGWHAWQESYLRTFIERDIARHQLNLSSIEVRRLLTMLAHSHGGLLNHSTLGRSLGYSYHTIQSMLDLFAGYFLIRRLQPFHANVKKRLVKASKVYLRDSGMLHYLLGIGTTEQLLTSPGRGNSFEGFMIQQIAALEELQRSGSAFYFYRTHSGAEIDLLIDRGNHRVGFEFKPGVATDAGDWKHLQSGIDDDVIHRGYVVYNGTREFPVTDKISVIPAAQILSGKVQ
jgi:predicted AAA+ superfamily ATPase